MLVTLENPGYSQIDIHEHRIEFTNEFILRIFNRVLWFEVQRNYEVL